MSEIKSGVPTALAAALEQRAEPPEAEQMDLLGLPEPRTADGVAFIAQRTGKAGRPLGARNKRTQKTVEWLMSVYQDPRAVLLAIAQAPVDELCARLNCKPMEALQEKRLAAIGVLPYIAQRQPLAVDFTERKIVYLNLIDGTVSAGDSNIDGLGLTARVVEGEIVKIDDAEGGT